MCTDKHGIGRSNRDSSRWQRHHRLLYILVSFLYLTLKILKICSTILEYGALNYIHIGLHDILTCDGVVKPIVFLLYV